eukprot:3044120-Rhodomonas_salina.1
MRRAVGAQRGGPSSGARGRDSARRKQRERREGGRRAQFPRARGQERGGAQCERPLQTRNEP